MGGERALTQQPTLCIEAQVPVELQRGEGQVGAVQVAEARDEGEERQDLPVHLQGARRAELVLLGRVR